MLREGRYYDDTPTNDFITNLNACRNNLYDNADLAYNQDPGTMMRRILNVFSIRPTVIKIQPLSNSMFNSNQLYVSGASGQFNMMQPQENTASHALFMNSPVYTVTKIPMINMTIPQGIGRSTTSKTITPISLNSSFNQTIWLNENKAIVPKSQQIIHSSEVLIFYVNRNINKVNMKAYLNPISFSRLPLTMSSFAKANDYPIDVPSQISLGSDIETFELRSVVSVTRAVIPDVKANLNSGKLINMVTGCRAMIYKSPNLLENKIYPSVNSGYYLYDPAGASIPHTVTSNGTSGYARNKPVSNINSAIADPNYDPSGSYEPENIAFYDEASRLGTVFIYAKRSGYDEHDAVELN
jgi:hypothetical protein